MVSLFSGLHEHTCTKDNQFESHAGGRKVDLPMRFIAVALEEKVLSGIWSQPVPRLVHLLCGRMSQLPNKTAWEEQRIVISSE